MTLDEVALARADRVLRRLASSGADPVVVRFDHDTTVDLIVGSRGAFRAARRDLDRMDWWLRLGVVGAWRLVRTATYVWADGPSVHLHRGVPSAPMPRLAVRPFERELLAAAAPDLRGVQIVGPAAARVFAAVQASRPGHPRRRWLDVLRSTPAEGAARSVADRGRVGATLAWAETAAASDRVASRSPFGGSILAAAWWRLSVTMVTRIGHVPTRSLLLGTPRIGGAPSRTRFAGLEVEGGPGVFVPRSITEGLVPLASQASGPTGTGVEVGTGTGAVALAVARTFPDSRWLGLDTSGQAVRWARRNAARLHVRNVRFARGSLLDPLPSELEGRVDVIVSSIPYVAPGRWGALDRAGAVEGPGADGLDLLRDLARQASRALRPGGTLALQIGRDQWAGFADELRALGFRPGAAQGGSRSDVVATAILA